MKAGQTPTLPSEGFKPKQSLGQNYLSDQNYVLKIVDAVRIWAWDAGVGGQAGARARVRACVHVRVRALWSPTRGCALLQVKVETGKENCPVKLTHIDDGARVVELGPGAGALSR